MYLRLPRQTFICSGPAHDSAVTIDWLFEHLEPDWHRHAACKGSGVTFVSGRVGEVYPASTRAICASCPVSAECLDFALADPSIIGFWGGTSTMDRRRMRRDARAARRAAA